MTTTTPRRSTRRTPGITVLLATGALTLGLLAGCSASSDDAGSASDSVPRSAAQGFADEGGDGSADSAAAESATQERQVVQTGTVSMRVKDAAASTQAVVTLVERSGGRIDDRSEQATTDESGGSANLVVRVPADKVDATIKALKDLGTVDSVDLKATDVTGAAQDLDARIHALQISVTRMEDLLAKATTSKDVIDAESALTERQSSLEELQSERARLADQVSLSTLTIDIYGPDVAPPVQTEGPSNFFDALAVGWSSLVDVIKGAVIVLGVLLPWLVLAGAVAAGVVAFVRWRRKRRPERPTRGPQGPVPAYALPGVLPTSAPQAPAQPTGPPAAPPASADDVQD
ncbi:DUF4349 domain-containing protein [Cellulomonas sp. JH27-2]|uniref:DUF4349 domain-containing protein n=1 Tax=Cellulomonas sp. JH27-2 TaxID=2774139 RepID=UPI001784EB18|nr:DUF4349 domain-containing protein [Cellulomonas sp. JH27-2]MBD8060361.1 DUF4349 domain-containing protein [Cellulomonas sp. JH27-2]